MAGHTDSENSINNTIVGERRGGRANGFREFDRHTTIVGERRGGRAYTDSENSIDNTIVGERRGGRAYTDSENSIDNRARRLSSTVRSSARKPIQSINRITFDFIHLSSLP